MILLMPSWGTSSLSSLGFLLSEHTSGVSPVIFGGVIQFYGQVDFVAIITVAAQVDDDRQERNVEVGA